ncbi:hypothetical protein V6667_00800 [Neisseria leonii]|uniref:Uncharacterized protein n=1 Tax=Neisseria leonii TaxID=2995413 RepID=A0A9X4E4H4_9NEIS|nr:hypothetical protein [Neisseria sp. 51.81]MDD9328579.1 hypothetical protein [Neisseria sp. 51.81]
MDILNPVTVMGFVWCGIRPACAGKRIIPIGAVPAGIVFGDSVGEVVLAAKIGHESVSPLNMVFANIRCRILAAAAVG